jgi:repressor LexA
VKTILTRKQHELLTFIDGRIRAEGVSPSFEEMKEAVNLSSKSGIHRLLSALQERGFVRRLPNRARALEVVKMPDMPAPARTAPAAANDGTCSIPLYGRVAAGVPIEAIAGIATIDVPTALLGSGEHYALEVAGDSMVEAGILDGDYALIRRAQSARDGEIVVALVDDAEATLKYFRREGSMVRLDPANRAYDPQRYEPARIKVQGCLSGLIRRYS